MLNIDTSSEIDAFGQSGVFSFDIGVWLRGPVDFLRLEFAEPPCSRKGYRDGAVLPTSGMTPVPENLIKQLLIDNPGGRDLGGFIAIFPLSRKLIAYLRDGAAAWRQGRLNEAERNEMNVAVARDVAPHFIVEINGASGFAQKPPGQRTITVDSDGQNERIGLHVDDWESAPLHSRRSCRNRISINIGVSERDFLFCPIDIVQMERWITSVGEQLEKTIASKVGRTFFIRNPATPIIRAKIPPGWAYIAPTENCMHDASTITSAFNDLTFTIRTRIAADIWTGT